MKNRLNTLRKLISKERRSACLRVESDADLVQSRLEFSGQDLIGRDIEADKILHEVIKIVGI